MVTQQSSLWVEDARHRDLEGIIGYLTHCCRHCSPVDARCNLSTLFELFHSIKVALFLVIEKGRCPISLCKQFLGVLRFDIPEQGGIA